MEIVPVQRVRGVLRPPSDKSLTHRAYLLAAAATGESVIRDPLQGEDCIATLRALEAMGLHSANLGDGSLRLTPSRQWRSPTGPLDCGNSGTTMRLLAGMIASRPIQATLVGDESLSRRPMSRIAAPLREMGAQVEGETAPLRIKGGALRGICHRSPVASAQVKSCLLLAGLRAEGETRVIEPSPSRDHTERMLAALGVRLDRAGTEVAVEGGQEFGGFEFDVPADISSAAFWMVAAAMLPGSEVKMNAVGLNPSRTGVLEVLDQAGVDIRIEGGPTQLGEPTGDLMVHHRGALRGFEIGGDLVPRLIDEIPVLAVLATQCEGPSIIRDAEELRVKESDRIQKVAEGLRSMGARVEEYPDGMRIEGPTQLTGATIDAAGDHRIAMSFAIAGMVASSPTTVTGAQTIMTSYPEFERHRRQLVEE